MMVLQKLKLRTTVGSISLCGCVTVKKNGSRNSACTCGFSVTVFTVVKTAPVSINKEVVVVCYTMEYYEKGSNDTSYSTEKL